MDTIRQIRLVWKPVIFALCLLPAALVITDLYEITGTLGANPVEAILDRFGNWAIRFIMITLAVTPLRKLTGWNWLTRFRRMLGLFTFFYVLMHFLVWLMLDRGLYFSGFAEVLPAVVEDLTERTFITLGFTALVLLTAMAVPRRRECDNAWVDAGRNCITVLMLSACWASGTTGGKSRKALMTRFITRRSSPCLLASGSIGICRSETKGSIKKARHEPGFSILQLA